MLKIIPRLRSKIKNLKEEKSNTYLIHNPFFSYRIGSGRCPEFLSEPCTYPISTSIHIEYITNRKAEITGELSPFISLFFTWIVTFILQGLEEKNLHELLRADSREKGVECQEKKKPLFLFSLSLSQGLLVCGIKGREGGGAEEEEACGKKNFFNEKLWPATLFPFLYFMRKINSQCQ